MKRGFKLRGRLRLHLGWPLWLSILLLPMVMQLYVADRKAGIIGTCYFLAFFFMCIDHSLRRSQEDAAGFDPFCQHVWSDADADDERTQCSICGIERRGATALGQ